MTKQIVCIKWGTRYGPEYPNHLYAMARRHTTGDLRFVCFTDDSTGVRSEVECLPLPPLPCELPKNSPGKWRKVSLWGPNIGVDGPALFIDLDSVIVASIDPYFEFGAPDDVILARNWARPGAKLGQTSVFRFPAGGNPQVLETFCKDPQGVADRFRFEQHFMTHMFEGRMKFWPEDWTKHFRMHCLPSFPARYWAKPRLPEGARIVTFPGGPDPRWLAQGSWGATRKLASPLTHVLQALGSDRVHKSRWQHLKRFALPSDWLIEAWRD